jgi:hypothetical protein
MFDFGILIPIVLFICIAWLIQKIVTRRALNTERLKLLEKGGDLKDLNLNSRDDSFNVLKLGITAIGFSIGVLVGSVLDQQKVMASEAVGYFFSISLFVGIALVVSHYISRREQVK